MEAATASAAKASQVLLTTLSREPAPDRADPDGALAERVEERGHPARASSGPDAKMVSWPCSAGSLLPETGASRSITSGRPLPRGPRRDRCRRRRWCSSAPRSRRGASAASMPWSRAMDMTASASVTIVTTIAARRARRRGRRRSPRRASTRSRVVRARGSRRSSGCRRGRAGRHAVAHRADAEQRNRLVLASHRTLLAAVSHHSDLARSMSRPRRAHTMRSSCPCTRKLWTAGTHRARARPRCLHTIRSI